VHDADGPRFLCDAMLGGLARWLRAAGYDAEFEHGIDDGELVARAGACGQVLLSSDAGVFARRPIKAGMVAALFVPRVGKLEQLGYVLAALALPVRAPRCMHCGGALAAVEKDAVMAEVPSGAFAREPAFWRCQRCRKVLWKGTHWTRIEATLERHGGGSRVVQPEAPGPHPARHRAS
jgi:uncharacterized protein